MSLEMTVCEWIVRGDVETCAVGLTADGRTRLKTAIHKRDSGDDHNGCRRNAVRRALRELALDYVYDSLDDKGKRMLVEGA